MKRFESSGKKMWLPILLLAGSLSGCQTTNHHPFTTLFQNREPEPSMATAALYEAQLDDLSSTASRQIQTANVETAVIK